MHSVYGDKIFMRQAYMFVVRCLLMVKKQLNFLQDVYFGFSYLVNRQNDAI